MPRRMITSEIWFNEKVAGLPDAGRLLFIGIFSNADDDGRLKASAKFLQARIFPYDNKGAQEVKALRDQCAKVGLIRLYTKNGHEYLDLPGWTEHQQIRKDRYTPSKLPAITEADEVSPLNQPVTFEPPPPTVKREHYERSALHIIAQKLKEGAWQPTNEAVTSVETNKRLGNRYADIVALTASREYILIEIKAYPLQPRDLGQVLGYRRALEKQSSQHIHTFLIGNGLGNLSLEEAGAADVQILNLKDVTAPWQPVKSTVETTRHPNKGEGRGVKSSLVNTPLLRKGARTKQVDPIVNEIFIEMRTYLGFPDRVEKDPIPSYGKEGQAIKRMLTRGFTREEVTDCWKQKVDARGGEFVSMTWVNEDIGKKGGKAGEQPRKGVRPKPPQERKRGPVPRISGD